MSDTETLTPAQLQAFASFISGKKILVADGNQSIRASLSAALSELGAKSSQIGLASGFEDALSQIRVTAPQIIITDYNLDKNFGLELIPVQRESRPKVEERLFVLVTGNAAESVVAEAAEEEVDAYILKPFTSSSIRFYLARAALAKLQPTGYQRELMRGRELLGQGKYEEALVAFSAALELHDSPSLACFYMGQSHDRLGNPDPTEQSYRNGLIFNEIHYKCSTALFDFYVAKGKSAEAYQVIKRIAQHFPISPQRLTKTIELAVRTQSFDDIGHYYSIFSQLDERREDLRKTVCAAMVVAAMFRLRKSETAPALELLQKAAITAAGSPIVLREIVMTLANAKLLEAADAFLKRFPPETRTGADFLCSDFALVNQTAGIEEIIMRGRKLLRDGIQDPFLHRIMIQRERECGHEDAAEMLETEAASIWPARAK